MRRADRAAGEEYLLVGIRPRGVAVARELDADGSGPFKQDAVHPCPGNDLQVGPLSYRLEIGARRTRPAPSAAGLLAPADAVAGPGRQIVDVRTIFDSQLLGRADDCLT